MGGLTFGGLYSEVYGMSNNFLNKMTKVISKLNFVYTMM